jgi:hypothetical protein
MQPPSKYKMVESARRVNANDLDKWLNLLEGYFLVHNFFDREKITLALLKVIPHVKD